jgi:hypothetical protein
LVDVPARRSAYPRICNLYLTRRATHAIPPDNLVPKTVEPPPDNSSAPLAFDTARGIWIEVTLIGTLSPTIAVILIFAVGNLGAGHAPAKDSCNGIKVAAGLTRLDQLNMGASLCSLATLTGIVQP